MSVNRITSVNNEAAAKLQGIIMLNNLVAVLNEFSKNPENLAKTAQEAYALSEAEQARSEAARKTIEEASEKEKNIAQNMAFLRLQSSELDKARAKHAEDAADLEKQKSEHIKKTNELIARENFVLAREQKVSEKERELVIAQANHDAETKNLALKLQELAEFDKKLKEKTAKFKDLADI